MNPRILLLVLFGTMSCCLSGCLFVRHATNVVREKEQQHPTQFESKRAQDFFVAGVHDLQTHKSSMDVQVSAVPFLWWYSQTKELSDNAIYNDQISVCDANWDGVISMEEAVVYRANVAEKISAVEKAKATPPATTEPGTAPLPASSPSNPPPGLIHLSSQTSETP